MSLRFVFYLLISIPAYTYSSEAPNERAGGNISEGQVKSAASQGCHGPDDNSFSPDWPNPASQNANYLSRQIRDFQSGARQAHIRQVKQACSLLDKVMVTGLIEQDIVDIAADFAAQKVKADAALNSVAGKKLYMGGNRYTHLPACAGCHGPNGGRSWDGSDQGPAGF